MPDEEEGFEFQKLFLNHVILLSSQNCLLNDFPDPLKPQPMFLLKDTDELIIENIMDPAVVHR